MDIGRKEKLRDAKDKLSYCLDKLEKADQYSDEIINAEAEQKQVDREELENNFGKLAGQQVEVVEDLTIQEIIGAIVAAEQELKEIEELMEGQDV